LHKPDAHKEDGEAVELDNRRWQEELRRVDCLKDCQFPASTEIEIGGTREQATITMKEKGLHANMQSDAAAFEAWALALLFPCRVQSVRIGVDPAADPGADPESEAKRHYERFLYRLKRFSELFPDRVKVNAVAPQALDPKIKRRLNQPNPRKKAPDAESRERMLAASATAPSESELEKALEISDAFRRRFQLEKVMRQWPVGLFKEHVAHGQQIFTGGKSAIDLIGIRGDTLVLFELKKEGNRKAGAVSELLFYASVMRDAIGDAAIFKFESKGAKKNCAIAPEDITRCSRICGVLLSPDFHPLISEPRMFEELNAAMKRLYADRPVHFETVAITRRPHDECGDFEFSNGRSGN
jgi:hypothetical protein